MVDILYFVGKIGGMMNVKSRIEVDVMYDVMYGGIFIKTNENAVHLFGYGNYVRACYDNDDIIRVLIVYVKGL